MRDNRDEIAESDAYLGQIERVEDSMNNDMPFK